MMMPKIFVTGATGFIGSALVELLLKNGYSVVAATRMNCCSEIRHARIKYINLDLIDPSASFEPNLFGCQIVINCAGNLHDPSTMKALHVDATAKLLDAFLLRLKNDDQVGRWVQLSSVGAYGPAFPASSVRVVTEETKPAPVGEYEISKTMADDIVIRKAAHHPELLTYCILRPSNVCGLRMRNTSLSDWARVIRRNLFFFVGPKDAVSTYIHVDDVCEALIACAFHPEAKNQIFNISNDCKQVDMVRGLAESCNASIPRFRIPEWLARVIARVFSGFPSFPLKISRIDALVSRTTYPCEKLFSTLGFRPKKEIPVAVKEIITNGF